MPHIHTEPGEHDFTASAFIMRLDTPEPQLLLHPHKLLGNLLQPGGHIELSENPWQAVVREITEETGFELDQLLLLQPKDRLKGLSNVTLLPETIYQIDHDFDEDSSHKHVDQAYAFVTDEPPRHVPLAGESTDLRWLSLEELNALNDKEIYPNIREVGSYVLSVCVRQWERVDPGSFRL